MTDWLNRFDRLLKAMSQGEPHKAEKRAKQPDASPDADGQTRSQNRNDDR
jgi:hypothetical protein